MNFSFSFPLDIYLFTSDGFYLAFNSIPLNKVVFVIITFVVTKDTLVIKDGIWI